MSELKRRAAYWTYDDCYGDCRSYYFAPVNATAPPYLRQIEVKAILDIASDGTLAGIELAHGDLPPPQLAEKEPVRE
jgi:hypothetical protein